MTEEKLIEWECVCGEFSVRNTEGIVISQMIIHLVEKHPAICARIARAVKD